MKFLVNFFKQNKRAVIWFSSIVGLYALIGFFLVPHLAEKQLLKTLGQRLSIKASVESLRFNPFTFSTRLTKLNLESNLGNPLVSVDSIYINFDPSELLFLEINLADVIIDNPLIHFTRFSPTENTLSRLLKKWQESPPDGALITSEKKASEEKALEEQTSDDEPLLAFEITNLDYHNGRIQFRDEVPKPVFETILMPINIQINALSTEKDEEKGDNALVVHLENDAILSVKNQFTLKPLHVNGNISLENFSLLTPYRYLQESLPFIIQDGRLSLSVDYQFHTEQNSPKLTIDNVSLQLSDLNAIETKGKNPFIHGGTLSVVNGGFIYPENILAADKINLDGFNVHLVRDEQGLINWQQIIQAITTGNAATASLKTTTSSTATAIEAPSQPNLKLDIQQLTISKATATFEDNFLKSPASINLNLSATLQDLTLEPESKMPFSSEITITSGGNINLAGDLQILPDLELISNLSIATLSLQPVQAYLNEFALIDIADGLVSAEASLNTGTSELFSYQGNLSVNNLILNDRQQKQRLVSLDSLLINNLDFSLSKKAIAVSEIIVDQLYGKVVVNKGGETNVGQTLLKNMSNSEQIPAPIPTPSPAKKQALDQVQNKTLANKQTATEADLRDNNTSFNVQLGKVKIINASSSFTDYNLPIVFNTDMQALNGHFSGFSSESSQPMEIDLEGKVDKFGLVEITGDLNPLDITKNTKIDMGFTNLDLTAITPYSMKFAGREIDKGRADIALKYNINNAKLKASNNLIIRGIELGEKFASSDAPSLPLDLAIALLKNSQGVIDLNIPVSGDVNNPEFDLGPAIRQALFNIITGIVTSPFKLLGKLAGGGSEELDNIRFRPGRSDLSPPEQEKLLSLATALAKRPQLILLVPAPLAETADKKALQKQVLKDKIEAELTHKGSEANQLKQRMRILEDFYTEAAINPTLDEIRETFTTPASENNKSSFDTLAYNNALRNALIPTQEISEEQLNALAKLRQTLVVEYLQTDGKLGADRITLQPITASKLKDQWLTMVLAVDIDS